jgi:hypothetical protein
MDSTTLIRLVCALFAVALIGLIVMRRKKSAE